MTTQTYQSPIRVYGRSDCPDTQLALRVLDDMKRAYEWIDLDQDPGRWAEALAANGNVRKVPTVVLPGGSVFIEPDEETLRSVR
ncbi:glutaredoxin domain-containing protein [Saccharopolyspora sp. NPDC002686]|uniref:glutaredoxin family protein n=1 Tax=Saccharopolyspora sp. NPDC002686 TaxID=3154541 RepID=UPI0033277823